MDIKQLRRVPAKHQAAVSAKINAIRLAAGNPGTHCPTCARTQHNPYRRIVGGKITEGCVDAFHHGFTCAGGSTHHHMSPGAHTIRRAELAWLEAL